MGALSKLLLIDICTRGTPAFVAGPKLMADMMEKQANQIIDHKAFGLQPKHRIYAQHGTASDDLPYAILACTHA